MLRRWCAMATAGLLLAAAVVVCPAQTLPSGNPAAAMVIAVTGQVSVMRDSVPWALNIGSGVQPQQMIVTGPDSFAVFQVSDGSTFEVYPNSRVIFRSTPGNYKDLLDLWIGRVKVQIQKLGGQPNYNRVHTPTAVISVRGTVFHVTMEDDDDTTLVLVEEGQVAVQHRLMPRGDPKLLNAGEYLRVYKNMPLASRSIDKGSVFQHAYRALSDALNTLVYRTARVPGGRFPTGGPIGTPLPGDPDIGPPPPPPPPPGDGGGPP